MALQSEQRTIIRKTFNQIAREPDVAAAMFYARLFEVAPSLRPMFPTDMREQGRKLVQTLAVVVSSIDRIETLVPVIQALGKRHVGYGVTREHYDIVGGALLWTITQALGTEATPEVIAAWTEVYTFVVVTATAGLYESDSVTPSSELVVGD